MSEYWVGIRFRQRANGWWMVFWASGQAATEIATSMVGTIGNEKTSQFVKSLTPIFEEQTEVVKLSIRNVNGQRRDKTTRYIHAQGERVTGRDLGNVMPSQPSNVADCVQWYMTGSAGGQALHSFSGMDKYEFDRDPTTGLPLLAADLRDRLNDFTEECKTKSLMIRTLKRPGDVGYVQPVPVIKILGSIGTANAYSEITLQETVNPFADRDRMSFVGLSRKKIEELPYRNTHVVHGAQSGIVGTSLATFYIRARYVGPEAGYLPGSLYATKPQFNYETITELGQFLDYGVRQRGPAQTTRGRAASVSYR